MRSQFVADRDSGMMLQALPLYGRIDPRKAQPPPAPTLKYEPASGGAVYYSPLRYPGGKKDLAGFVSAVCRIHGIDGHYVEPYAGGAAIGLQLLLTGQVRKITINDLDRSVYAFWKAITMDPDGFCSRIRRTRISANSWNAAHKVQKNKKHASIRDLGFSTFFLNRTNYSGILNAGMMGGASQASPYGMGCRFDKKTLIDRIKKIAEWKKSIHVSNKDAMDLVSELSVGQGKNTLYYFDPPYYAKGAYLYMNHYKNRHHEEVARTIQKIRRSKWIVSYDNARKITRLYSGYQRKKYSLRHTARSSRFGGEVLFFSKNLRRIDEAVAEIPRRGTDHPRR